MITRIYFALLIIGLFLSSAATGQVVGDLIDVSVNLGSADRTEAGKRFFVRVTSDPILIEFTGIAVQGTSLADELVVDTRIESTQGWTNWLPLHVVSSATDGTFVAGFHGDTVYSNARVELRIRGDAEHQVEIQQFGACDNRLDEDATSPPAPDFQVVRGNKSGLIIPPPLITRAEWDAEPFRGTPSPLENPVFRYMTFHHAAGFSATTLEEGIAQVYAIQDLHQNVRGWSDIGYQFVIDRSGRVYQGRPFLDGSTSLEEVPVLALGAHVGGNNSGNIGVSILGCYHPPAGSSCTDELTPESLETYTTLFAFFSERYGIEPTLIRGHRDFSSTACPGDNNYPLIPGLIEDVEELLKTGNASLGSADLDAEIIENDIVRVEWTTLEDFGIESYRLEREYQGESQFIYEGTESVGSYNDSGISEAALVTYNLYASGNNERNQLLNSVEIDVEFADEYILTEIFPNPAQSEVQFRYKLKNDGIVDLSVFDVTGRLVQSISKGFLKSDRWYNSRLDVSDFPPGLYFYRIEVDGYAGIDFDESHSFVVVR